MTIQVDDFSPRYKDSTANPLNITLVDHLGAPYDLRGLTLAEDFSLYLIPVEGGVTITGTGTWTLTGTGTDGGVQYAWDSDDVGIEGMYAVRVEVKIGGEWLPFDVKYIRFKDPAKAE